MKKLIKKKFKKSIYNTRQLFPNPKLWAVVSRSRVPKSYIVGKQTGLSRPEAVAYTALGEFMAISNSGNHSICLYKRNDSTKNNPYSSIPDYTFSDKKCLDYVHDIAFSPNDKTIVSVARESHTLSSFSIHKEISNNLENKVQWSIEGDSSSLKFPASVAIHPSGKCLAIANSMHHGITLYRSTKTEGHFDSKPFQTISNYFKHGFI